MAVLAPPVQVVASGAPPFVQVPSGAPPFVVTTGPAPPITIVASGAPPITLFNADGSIWSAHTPAGGEVLLVGETDGFATDFTHPVDAERVAVKTAGSVVSSGLSFFTQSGTSSKWVYNAAGVLVNIPVGTLALDYDPVTHAAKGLLCEPQATNLALQSNAMDNGGIWSAEGGTVAGNNQTGPDGTLTADTFTENTATATHDIYGASTVTANADYTVSCFYKMGTRRYASIGWSDGTNGAYGVFDLQSGVVGSSAALGTGTKNSASIQALPNGWYRCVLSGKFPTGTTAYAMFAAANAATITPDGFGRQSFLGTSSTLFFGGVQIEAGTVATSPIPTLGATVTRAADKYNATATSIGTSATAGSWWAEAYLREGSTDRVIIGSNTGGGIPLYHNSGAFELLNGTLLFQAASTIGLITRAMSTFTSGDRAITGGGLAPATDAGVTTQLLGAATIYFGSDIGTVGMTGWLRKARYLPRRPSNAEMQTMTT